MNTNAATVLLKRSAAIFAGGWLLFCAGCFNPFFPPTGEPGTVGMSRATPAGTVQQLFQAYETRQINLFMDLTGFVGLKKPPDVSAGVAQHANIRLHPGWGKERVEAPRRRRAATPCENGGQALPRRAQLRVHYSAVNSFADGGVENRFSGIFVFEVENVHVVVAH